MSRTQRHALAWALLIVALHIIPRSGIVNTPGGRQFAESRWQDKVAHAALFATLAWLWMRDPRSRWLPFAAAAIGLGVILEVAQDRLPLGRSGSIEDLMSDTIGLALGTALALWLRQPHAVVADPA
ncbi:MAG: VanZ family protein [Isosphaeraceae bacterium]